MIMVTNLPITDANKEFYRTMTDRMIKNANSQRLKNIQCNECGSEEITLISYGLPGWIVIDADYEIDPRITSLLEEKKIVLGGCCKNAGSPKYFCRKCSNRFGTIGE